jgi:hypothetical protein
MMWLALLLGPTLVEFKRCSEICIREEVVRQLLDYGANLLSSLDPNGRDEECPR